MTLRTIPFGLFLIFATSLSSALFFSISPTLNQTNSLEVFNLVGISGFWPLLLTPILNAKLFIGTLVIIFVSVISNILTKCCLAFINSDLKFQNINSLSITIHILLLYLLISSPLLPAFLYTDNNLEFNTNIILRFSTFAISLVSSFYLIFNLGIALACAFEISEKQTFIKILYGVGLFFLMVLVLSLLNKTISNPSLDQIFKLTK